MASRTITTTAAREAELDLYLPEENARRAALGQGAVDKDALVQGMNNQVIDSWIKTRAERNAIPIQTLRDAYLAATPAQQAAARAAIGL